MLRKTMVALVAGSGIMLAGTAVSAKPTGGIWSDNSPRKSGAKTRPAKQAQDQAKAADPAPGDPAGAANADAGLTAETAANANAAAPAGANSQGAANANLGAVVKADANSALAAGAVASTALPGLTTGLNVKKSDGSALGTVSQVVTGTDGTIRMVVVTGSDGQSYRLMPNQLSIAGNVVTTTQTELEGG